MKKVGYLIFGDGKFGVKTLGHTIENDEAAVKYWETRGYQLAPCYINLDELKEIDFSEYSKQL